MRLRTFTAKTMPEVMALVRQQLGGDAIILSTSRAGGGISVTAALEHGDGPEQIVDEPAPPNDPTEALHEMLLAHGVPAELVERMLTAALERAASEPLAALA